MSLETYWKSLNRIHYDDTLPEVVSWLERQDKQDEAGYKQAFVVSRFAPVWKLGIAAVILVAAFIPISEHRVVGYVGHGVLTDHSPIACLKVESLSWLNQDQLDISISRSQDSFVFSFDWIVDVDSVDDIRSRVQELEELALVSNVSYKPIQIERSISSWKWVLMRLQIGHAQEQGDQIQLASLVDEQLSEMGISHARSQIVNSPDVPSRLQFKDIEHHTHD